MNSIRYPYTKISIEPHRRAFSKNSYFVFPRVRISLDIGKNKFQTFGIIDTGSQYCLFDPKIAQILGITDFRNTEEISPLAGVGGKEIQNKAYFHDVNLTIYKDFTHYDKKNAWEYKTKVGFLETPAIYQSILGIYGFFDHFRFNSNLWNGFFELEYLAE